MIRWEYLCERLAHETGRYGIAPGELMEHLNERGESGWELVSTIPSSVENAADLHKLTVIFRRPKTELA
jgi:hypothetical protein